MAAPRGPGPDLTRTGPDDRLRPTQCRHPIRLIGATVDRATGEITPGVEVAARCRSWRCEGCGRRLKRLHRSLVVEGIRWHHDQGRFARFLTLTYATDHGAQIDNPDDVKACTKLVSRFIQEIRRTHSPRIEYYAVKEATKRGRLHVHLVTTGPYLRKCRHRQGDRRYRCPDHGTVRNRCCAQAQWIDPCHGARGCQTRLARWQNGELSGRRPRPCTQAIARRLGFGHIDVRKIGGPGEAAAYVAKYLDKQIGRRWPRYSRRSSYSLGRLTCDHHPDNIHGRRCCPEAYRRTFPRFNRWSQHRLVRQSVGAGRALRRVFAIRGFCGAVH